MRIAALLLGAIEVTHEVSSQLARASEVTWKWSVFSLLLVLRALPTCRPRACLIFYSGA